jgi:hypothetical protein
MDHAPTGIKLSQILLYNLKNKSNHIFNIPHVIAAILCYVYASPLLDFAFAIFSHTAAKLYRSFTA